MEKGDSIGDVELQEVDGVEVIPATSLEDALQEAGEKQERRTIMVRSIAVMGVILLIILILAGLLATLISIGVIDTHSNGADPPSYYDHNELLISVEFQISLNPKEDWTDRSGMLDHWIYSLNRYGGPDLWTLSLEDAHEMAYSQYHIDATGSEACKADEDTKIRVRNYVELNYTTIDIKHEADINEPGACGEPFWPAENYLNVSRQKCEEDVHPCFNKFARATSVMFDGEPDKQLTTCGDLTKIWPDAFPTINEENEGNSLKNKKSKNYWRLQWKGIANNSTNWEVTFGIEYDRAITLEEILSNSTSLPIEEGEFSMRFYTAEGKDRDPDVQLQLQNVFYRLVIEYDTYVDHVMCAYEYFLGQADSDIGYHK